MPAKDLKYSNSYIQENEELREKLLLSTPSELRFILSEFKTHYGNLARIFENTQDNARFIFGINKYTEALLEKFKVNAVIDDFRETREFMGTPVISTLELKHLVQNKSIEKQHVILIASGGKPQTAKKKLFEMLKGSDVLILDYSGFQKSSLFNLPDLVMNENFEQIYDENYLGFLETYSLLKDSESRVIFERIMQFRYTHNIKYLSEFQNAEELKYFEGFIRDSQSINFIDVGSFNGSSTLTFMDLFPNHNRILVIEPSPDNYGWIVERFKTIKGVTHINCGVADAISDRQISGKEDNTRLVEIDKLGDKERGTGIIVPVNTIDNLVNENGFRVNELSYLVMDIEGMEVEALTGAKNFIQQHKPIIGVCVYHNPLDFIRIPRLILKMNPDYDLYLRHYTESIYESVIYFIPR